MKMNYLACLILICALTACAPSPTPTPTQLPPTPTPTLLPTATSGPAGDYVPSDIPRCDGAKSLGHALDFQWAGVDAIGGGSWFYYHCDESPDDLAAAFRPKMTAKPYEWGEINWVARPEGTLGVYFNTVQQVWGYLWFLPPDTGLSGSYLVFAEVGTEPLELPCCK